MVERRFDANRKHKAGFHLKVTQEHGTQYGTSGWHCCMGRHAPWAGLALSHAASSEKAALETQLLRVLSHDLMILGALAPSDASVTRLMAAILTAESYIIGDEWVCLHTKPLQNPWG